MKKDLRRKNFNVIGENYLFLNNFLNLIYKNNNYY